MTFEQMKENLKNIKLLEKDLMRDLTNAEREIVINKGWEEFLFNHLGFTDEDFSELKAIKSIISAFYTQDEEVLDKAIQNAPDTVYFVLRDILDRFDGLELCACPNGDKCENPVCNPEIKTEKKDPVADFAKFLQELYNSLPKKESSWFNKLTDDIREDLFEVYKENRNEHQNVTDDILGGILTDALKDDVVEDMVEKLKKGEVVEMTNDEYLEVADYLCEHENKVFLHNDNGKVKLIKF